MHLNYQDEWVAHARIAFRGVALWLGIASSASYAEVMLDGSTGPAGSLSGPEFQIEARFGREVGTNLFHSFKIFDVNSGESASFNDVGATGLIENILARVTGGVVSNIDGAIKTSFSNSTPNLFLLNPAGLVFGPNATLDVQGSFHASTADSIKLVDGAQFDALVPSANDALLTAAPPSAFGFLPSEPERRTITVSGSKLGVPTGESLSFVGKFDPEIIPIVAVHVESGVLDAPGGQVGVVQTRSNSEVPVETPNSPLTPKGPQNPAHPANFNNSEDVLVHTGVLTVTGNAIVGKEGGNISVDVARLALRDGGMLDSEVFSSGNAGDIEINATDSVSLTGSKDSAIIADAGRDGNAGHIRISAPTLELSGGLISASAFPLGGTGGTIELEVENLSLRDAARIATSNVGARMGGQILINAKDSVLISGPPDDASIISSAVSGEGDAGRVFIRTAQLTLRDGGTISTAAEFGSGNAGEIRLVADELLVEDGGFITSTTQDEGSAGPIFVSSRNLTINNGGSLSSTTTGFGRGGAINVDAPEGEVTVAGVGSAITTASLVTDQNAENAGPAGRIMIEAGRFVVSDAGEVSASTATMGMGGDLEVIADSVLLDGQNSGVSVDSEGTASQSGNSGNLRLVANDTVEVRNQAAIRADTLGPGAGGNVAIESPDIRISSGGAISASTGGSGRGGNIEINEGNGKKGTVSLSGPSTAITTQSETTADGDAGSVAIRTGRLTVSDSAEISASTSGNGKGGSVNIQASNIEVLNGGEIAARSTSTSDRAKSGDLSIRADEAIRIFNGSSVTVNTAQADAGDIDLDAGFLLHLRDNGRITTSAAVDEEGQGQGDGGDITIDPVFTVLDGDSSITANAFEGRAGNIHIRTNFIFQSPDSEIRASNRFGVEGNVEIESPETDVVSGALALPESFLDAARLLSERCRAQAIKGASSFIVITGRGGVPPGPETVLPSPIELGVTPEEIPSPESSLRSLSHISLALSPVDIGCRGD